MIKRFMAWFEKLGLTEFERGIVDLMRDNDYTIRQSYRGYDCSKFEYDRRSEYGIVISVGEQKFSITVGNDHISINGKVESRTKSTSSFHAYVHQVWADIMKQKAKLADHKQMRDALDLLKSIK